MGRGKGNSNVGVRDRRPLQERVDLLDVCAGQRNGSNGQRIDDRKAQVVEAQIGGKLAQLGARLINGVAKKMADEFFAKFADAVKAGA